MSARSAFAIAIALAAASCQGGKPGDAPAVSGRAAPDLAGKTLDGERVRLTDYLGKVVLLNVWATWCKPCRQELPELARLHDSLASQGFMVLAVSVDKPRDLPKLRHMVDELALPFQTLVDPDGRSVAAFEIRGYPTSFIVGRDGTLRWRRDGMITAHDGEVDKQLQWALAEPAPE